MNAKELPRKTGLFFFVKSNVDKGACACAEQCCALVKDCFTECAVYKGRNKQCCRYDSKQLLECENKIRTELGFVVDVIDKFHRRFLPESISDGRINSKRKSAEEQNKSFAAQQSIQKNKKQQPIRA